MIRKQELEQVREINRKLPFAAPIEPGPTFAEWAEGVLDVKLFPAQILIGEAIMRGDKVVAGRKVGVSFTRDAIRRYIQDATDD